MKPERDLTRKIICGLIIAACIVSLLPLFEISKYNVPSADDYNYARTTFRVWNETHSLVEVIKEAVNTTVRFWNTWQGLYVSAFLLALQPGIFGGKWYAITGFFMLILLIGSIMFFSVYLIKHLLKGRLLDGVTIGCLAAVLAIQYMPSCVEGLYWFNGAVNYGFFFAVLLIYICLFIELQRENSSMKENILLVLCLIGAFLLEGGNHVTALMGVVFTAAVVLLRCRKDRKKTIKNIIILCAMSLFFYLNLSSPGTMVRLTAINANAEMYDIEKLGAVKTIITAAAEGIKSVEKWFGLREVVVIMIALPILTRITKYIRSELHYTFPCPLVVVVASVAWISLMYCPTLYAQGHTGGGRLSDVVYYSFVILLFLNAAYIAGWIQQFISEEAVAKLQTFHWKYMITAATLLIAVLASSGKSAWGYKAKTELETGKPMRYAQEYYAREAVLTNSKGQNVELPEYSVKPKLIFLDDITEDPTDWRNTGMAAYYELESVVTVEED